MTPSHLPADGGEDKYFNDEIEPGKHHEQTEIERKRTTVEGEDIGIFHQGQTAFAELMAQFEGNSGR